MIINMLTVMTIDQQRGIYRNIMLILYWEGWAESVETLLPRHRWNSNMNINTHILAGIRCALYIFINVTNTWNTVWNPEASESLPQCARDETLPGFLDTCSAASAQRIQSLHLSSFTHSPGCLPTTTALFYSPQSSENVLPNQLFKLSGVICLFPCDAHSLHFPVNQVFCV